MARSTQLPDDASLPLGANWGPLLPVLTTAALAVPDRRRRRSCRFSGLVLALAAFAGPSRCSRVGSTRHHTDRGCNYADRDVQSRGVNGVGAGPRRRPCLKHAPVGLR